MRAGKLLRIYLQDHDALAVIADRLIRRSIASNEGTPLGDLLTRLRTRSQEDRRALHEVMDHLGVRPSRLKIAFGWAAERSGTLKLNGRVLRYSPLSRVFELEGLAALLSMRIRRWEALRTLVEKDLDLSGIDFEALIERTQEDLADLRAHHADAAALAL